MATFSPEDSSFTESVGAGKRRRRLILPTVPPLVRFIVGVAILAPLSVIAFLQPTRTDPLKVSGWRTVDWWRYPLEWNARSRLPTLECSLHAIQALPNSTSIWAVGDKGIVISSVDGGKTWTKKGIGAQQLAFDQLSVPAAAPSPQSSPTRTPTPSPTPIPSPSPPEIERLITVSFTDKYNGEVVSSYGNLYKTIDGGNTWSREFLTDYLSISRTSNSFFNRLPLRALQLREPTLGFVRSYIVITDYGRLYNLSDFDFNPFDRFTGRSFDYDFNSVYRLGVGPATWIVGMRGRIWRTLNGSEWTDLTRSGIDFYGTFFTDKDHGWVVGGNGSILKTDNGGVNWISQTSGTTAQLNTVTFLPDGKHGWVAGNEGIILETSDGGATWIRRTLENTWTRGGLYWRFPAPWYFVSLFLIGLFVLRKPKLPDKLPEESIADVLVSDRPVEEPTGDVLAFTQIACGLSRFLRNENTNPPLTIAITGEWGTGKSSLMNLVRADLRSYKFRPVWFNAWHHQKEEQMFAALLESIKLQAVPRWWTTRGIVFRARLLQIRGARQWFPLLLLILAIYVLVLYYYYSDIRISTIATLPLSSTEVLGLLPVVAGVLTFAGAIWRGISAFGLTPATLIAGVSGGIRIGGLEAQTSFRQKFANQFNDVTRALGKRSLLIFIDDLDRCRPENVLETLETVNFLTTSGECFVIIGMAREYVERCVGRAFNEVAQEMVDDAEGKDTDAESIAKQRRIEFARQYLDKLVNIEVPVPAPKQSQSFALLIATTHEEEQFKPANGWQRFKLSIVTLLEQRWKLVAGVLLAIVLAILGHNFARELAGLPVQQTSPLPNTAPSPQPSIQPSPAPSRAPTPSATPTPTPTASRTPPPTRETERPNLISAARDPFTSFVLPLLGLFAVIALGSALLKQPELVVKDSPNFVAALQIWHPILFARLSTPRATKRFMNLVRYLAMRQRRQNESHPPMTQFFKRLKAGFLGGKTAADVKDEIVAGSSNPKPIPDEVLVALAALQQLNPAYLIERPGPVRSADKVWPWSLLDDPLVRARLDKTVKEHEAKFGDLSILQMYREQFLEMISRVKVR